MSEIVVAMSRAFLMLSAGVTVSSCEAVQGFAREVEFAVAENGGEILAPQAVFDPSIEAGRRRDW